MAQQSYKIKENMHKQDKIDCSFLRYSHLMKFLLLATVAFGWLSWGLKEDISFVYDVAV